MKLRAALCFALASSCRSWPLGWPRGQEAAAAVTGTTTGGEPAWLADYKVLRNAYAVLKKIPGVKFVVLPLIGGGIVRKIRLETNDDQGDQDATAAPNEGKDGKSRRPAIRMAALREKAANMADYVFFREVTFHGCVITEERFDDMVEDGMVQFETQIFRGFPPKSKWLRWLKLHNPLVYRPSPQLAEVHLRQQLALVLGRATSSSNLPETLNRLCPHGVTFSRSAPEPPPPPCALAKAVFHELAKRCKVEEPHDFLDVCLNHQMCVNVNTGSDWTARCEAAMELCRDAGAKELEQAAAYKAQIATLTQSLAHAEDEVARFKSLEACAQADADEAAKTAQN